MYNTFESQLSASARRLRKQSENTLSTPETVVLPQRHTRYWGWFATPAAAFVGLVIGLSLQRPAQHPDNFTVPAVIADNSGHSIADDGTDYSLLVSL